MTTYFIKRLADYSKETLIAEIKRVASIVKKEKISQNEFNKHSKVNAITIKRKFGSWEKALIICKLGHRYDGSLITEKNKSQRTWGIPKEKLICEIKVIAGKLNKETITLKDFNTNSIYGSGVVITRFGSWEKALKEAGLLTPNRKNISENDLFENILAVWTHYGRQPKSSEMNKKPSTVSKGTYANKFGSWIKALNAFEVFANNNQDEHEEEKIERINTDFIQLEKVDLEIKIKEEDKHKIPLGLRFKVFDRDRFRCVKCGRSPATELINIKLHADHIIPFSKGGKTILDNLQTTCKDCNLGKGNRYTE